MSFCSYSRNRSSRLLYPDPFFGGLVPASVGADLQKIDDFWTFQPGAYRVPIEFNQSIRLLVSITSDVGTRNNWIYAGVLAQVVANAPAGDPKQSTTALYLDERVLQLETLGYPYYLEFWPVRWLSDYRLEIWAQRALPQLIFQIQGTPLTIGGEPFTIDGVILFL